MPSEFLYIKKANQILITNELSKSSISSLINTVLVIDNKIRIFTTRNLTPAEEKVLYEVVAKHNPPSLEEQMTKDRVLSAIAFGQSIIVEVATENIMLKLSINDILYMLTKFAGIKAMLESGSLYTALATLQSVKPDAIMTQDRLNKYINKLKLYLGIT